MFFRQLSFLILMIQGAKDKLKYFSSYLPALTVIWPHPKGKQLRVSPAHFWPFPFSLLQGGPFPKFDQ